MNLDRSKIPQPFQEIKFPLPEIKNFVLSNGLKVLFVQREFLPIIRMNMITACGSIFDPKNKNGLANLFSMMIDEGAGDYNALELSEEFDILGSDFGVNCNHDNIFLSVRSLSENFERSLELFSLIILKPHFNDQDFQRERRKIEVKLLQQKDDPEELANLAFDHLVHGKNNPYAFPILGYDDSINKINNDEIKDFYQNNFSPHNSHLIVVGNISEEKLIASLENHLKNWDNKPNVITPKFEFMKNKKSVSILHKEGAVQTEIRMGHRSSGRQTPDYFSKMIMNAILGGQFTSRINLNLRENKGFTYGASSNFIYYTNSGEFCVSTSVSTENTLDAVKEILNELENIKNGVTLEEFELAKSLIIRRFPSQFETDGQIASNLSLLAIHNFPLDYFNTYVDSIKNITLEEVNRAAVDNILLDELSIVLVGDKNKLLNSFSSADIGEVKIINEKGEVTE
jgi:predicted Zn-dependent peptidase